MIDHKSQNSVVIIDDIKEGMWWQAQEIKSTVD